MQARGMVDNVDARSQDKDEHEAKRARLFEGSDAYSCQLERAIQAADSVSRQYWTMENACDYYREMFRGHQGPEKLMRSLSNGEWLNDSLVDQYLNAVLLSDPQKVSRLGVAGCILFTEEKIYGPRIACDRRLRLSRNPFLRNIFESSLFVAPMFVHGNHFVLVVVEIKKSLVTVLDSWKPGAKDAIKRVKSILDFEHKRLRSAPLPSNWHFQLCEPIEKQTDSISCGVYVCRYFEVLLSQWNEASFPDFSRVFPSEFEQSAMLMRGRIEQEINKWRAIIDKETEKKPAQTPATD
jgi:hypothetical protein